MNCYSVRKAPVPKARPSIHSHSADVNMNERGIIHNQEEDCDEVDNILSKPCRSDNYIRNRRHLPSRSSVDADLSDKSEEEEEDDILIKSNLAELFSANSRDYEYNQHHADISSSSNTSTSLNLSREYLRTVPQKPKSDGSSWIFCIVAIIGAGILALLYEYSVLQWYDGSTLQQNIYDKDHFNHDVKSLAKDYKVKLDSLLQVRSGIEMISQKEDTGSFIFTYDGNVDTFNPHKFDNFMDQIATTASRYLRNDTKNVKPVILDNSKIMRLKSDVDLIYKFRENLYETGVLLVKNIERVPSELAMAFHYYCDEYNPLVKKSAIFFTLDVAKCSVQSRERTTHDYIERCLKAKWRDLDKDKIAPLLTRVVNVIVDVTSV